MGARLAVQDGTRVGCRGDLACVRAVGLFFGTQTGKTEDVAGKIAEAAGLEAQDVGDISASDLTGFDGLIVGAPTWHTGADEQRSGTAWDDYLDEIKALDMGGKPVAVFGLGDQAGYGEISVMELKSSTTPLRPLVQRCLVTLMLPSMTCTQSLR